MHQTAHSSTCPAASDKHRGDDADSAADRFKEIATAYSILRCWHPIVTMSSPSSKALHHICASAQVQQWHRSDIVHTVFSKLPETCLQPLLTASSNCTSGTLIKARSLLLYCSDTEKRRKYDVGGAAALDAGDMEIDISSLGTMGTAFAAMFSKMGFRIKTAVSQQVPREPRGQPTLLAYGFTADKTLACLEQPPASASSVHGTDSGRYSPHQRVAQCGLCAL